MSRTIEEELCLLTGLDTVEEAVTKLGFLSGDVGLAKILVEVPWYRAGAETYVCRFSALGDDGSRNDLVAKACIALTQSLSVERTLEEWVRRRSVLAGGGAETPMLYAYGNGILIEEYIPLSIREAMAGANDPDCIATSAAKSAAVVCATGFAPVAFFDDLRSRRNDAVIIDFGADLGPCTTGHYAREKLTREFWDFLASLDYRQADAALRCFNECLDLCLETRGHA